jgi:hypothetical protein
MQSKAEFRVQSLFELTTTPATSTGRHGPFLLVRLRVWPERHLAQSCAIALRSPASERPSDLKRYSPDIHSKPACLLVLCSLQRRPGRVLCFTGAYHHRHRVRVRVRVRIRVRVRVGVRVRIRVRVRALDITSHREDEDEREREDEAEFERLVDQGMHIEGGKKIVPYGYNEPNIRMGRNEPADAATTEKKEKHAIG